MESAIEEAFALGIEEIKISRLRRRGDWAWLDPSDYWVSLMKIGGAPVGFAGAVGACGRGANPLTALREAIEDFKKDRML